MKTNKQRTKELISEMLNVESIDTIKEAFKEVEETERLDSAIGNASNDTYRKLLKQRKAHD